VTVPEIAALITALGIGGILAKLADRIWGALTGRAKERRSEVDRAWARADDEARKRRVIEEHASRLTRRLIEAPCVDDKTIEPFPTYKETS
jgi:hypothetical protein